MPRLLPLLGALLLSASLAPPAAADEGEMMVVCAHINLNPPGVDPDGCLRPQGPPPTYKRRHHIHVSF